ncbi:hypothetical protein [Leptothermofonsia sichuanensis]|nr:hypothetical protein [Leptothermofonsia sichuanensis]
MKLERGDGTMPWVQNGTAARGNHCCHWQGFAIAQLIHLCL